jgi:large subunit ribosomal protein L35
MMKLKTNRSAAKRFKATGTGKVKRNKAYARHLLSCKTTKQKRKFRRSGLVDSANIAGVRQQLPYL